MELSKPMFHFFFCWNPKVNRNMAESPIWYLIMIFHGIYAKQKFFQTKTFPKSSQTKIFKSWSIILPPLVLCEQTRSPRFIYCKEKTNEPFFLSFKSINRKIMTTRYLFPVQPCSRDTFAWPWRWGWWPDFPSPSCFSTPPVFLVGICSSALHPQNTRPIFILTRCVRVEKRGAHFTFVTELVKDFCFSPSEQLEFQVF